MRVLLLPYFLEFSLSFNHGITVQEVQKVNFYYTTAQMHHENEVINETRMYAHKFENKRKYSSKYFLIKEG